MVGIGKGVVHLVLQLMIGNRPRLVAGYRLIAEVPGRILTCIQYAIQALKRDTVIGSPRITLLFGNIQIADIPNLLETRCQQVSAFVHILGMTAIQIVGLVPKGSQCAGQTGEMTQTVILHHQAVGRIRQVSRKGTDRSPVRPEAVRPSIGEVHTLPHPSAQLGCNTFCPTQCLYERGTETLQLNGQHIGTGGCQQGVCYIIHLLRVEALHQVVTHYILHASDLLFRCPMVNPQ